jgi:hypothetical protein
MRLWSISPHYLDRQGLLAVWREGLLAQKVLLGKTKGYKNHPQLERFKNYRNPSSIGYLMNSYLFCILIESMKRGYNFDKSKIGHCLSSEPKLTVTRGQLEYEFKHLISKLLDFKRNPKKAIQNLNNAGIGYMKLQGQGTILFGNVNKIEPHPLFKVIEGDIEPWEKIK